MNRSRNESGFSLIELMVVVAILGILATIAIPNFQRFQARAKQKSGLALLSGYYTAMKATHVEYTHYFGDFVAIGFRPEGELDYHLYGNEQGLAIIPTGVTTELGCFATLVVCATPGYIFGVDWTAGLSAFPPVPGVVTRNAFTANIAADLRGEGGGPGNADMWSINENKQIINWNPGLP